MAPKKITRFKVGYYHKDRENSGLFKLPCLTEFDFTTRKANIYFDISKLTKNRVPYPFNISEEELVNRGYELMLKSVYIQPVKTRAGSNGLLRSIVRGKGKGIVSRLLSDGVIK